LVMSSNGWKEYKFSEILSTPLKNGVNKPTKVRGDGYKMVNMGELFANPIIRNMEMARAPMTDSELKNSLLQPEDLLFARQSLTIEGAGKCSLFIGDDEPYTFEGHLIRARVNREIAFPRYIYYYFNSFVGKSKIETLVHVTAAAGIRSSDLSNLKIELPPLPAQRRIADILSALDEKIELNRQTNATLEAIAQSIFREWFVEFNFPGATGETIDSELGMIPKGWKVGKVKELCNVNKNVITKKDNFDWIDYIEISEVAKGKIGNVSRYKYGEEPSRAKRKLNHGDTVLSTVRPNRGSFFLSINPPNTLIASTGFAVFSPTKAPYSFLYLLLTDPEKLEYYGHVADGAAYPAVNPNLIMDMDIVIPEDGILNRFHSIAEPILNTMIHNEQQSATLAALRDALLPKLMSGEMILNAVS